MRENCTTAGGGPLSVGRCSSLLMMNTLLNLIFAGVGRIPKAPVQHTMLGGTETAWHSLYLSLLGRTA